MSEFASTGTYYYFPEGSTGYNGHYISVIDGNHNFALYNATLIASGNDVFYGPSVSGQTSYVCNISSGWYEFNYQASSQAWITTFSSPVSIPSTVGASFFLNNNGVNPYYTRSLIFYVIYEFL
jgi:hypothetical protein